MGNTFLHPLSHQKPRLSRLQTSIEPVRETLYYPPSAPSLRQRRDMLNFEIKKSTRKCAESGRDFEPGEVFFSALIENEDGSTSRQDFSSDAWEETPEDCIGWWKSQVPETGKGKIFWAPRKIMLAYFEHVLDQPDSQDIAFVASLLLIQKKHLTLVDDGKADSMTVRDRSSKESYSVPIVEVEGTRLAEIQAMLSEQLFMDEPIDDLEETDE